MKFMTILLALALSFVMVGNVNADQHSEELTWTFDAEYVSKYIWRGYNIYGSQGAFQPSVDVDLFGTGFGVNVWSSFPVTSGYDRARELNYQLYYGITLLEEELTTEVKVNYTYFDYYRTSSDADMYETGIELRFPQLLPKMGDVTVTPSYYVSHDSPAKSGTGVSSGWFHILGLDFDFPITCPLREVEQVICFSTEVVYNDGVLGSNSDWSHVVAGLATAFDMGHGLTVTPGVYFQKSMENSVNDRNELWGSLKLSYTF